MFILLNEDSFLGYDLSCSRKRKTVSGTNFGFESRPNWQPFSLPFLSACVDVCIPSFNEYRVCTRLDTFQIKVPPMCKSICFTILIIQPLKGKIQDLQGF